MKPSFFRGLDRISPWWVTLGATQRVTGQSSTWTLTTTFSCYWFLFPTLWIPLASLVWIFVVWKTVKEDLGRCLLIRNLWLHRIDSYESFKVVLHCPLCTTDICTESQTISLSLTGTQFNSEFFGKMKNWPPRFFLGWFSGDTNFLQSKAGKTENVVITEGLYDTRNYVYIRLQNVD